MQYGTEETLIRWLFMLGQQETIREAVGVFDSLEKLDAAVAELEITAFPRQDISVLSNEQEIAERYGSAAIRTEWLEDNPDAPRASPVRPEEKAIGASVIVGFSAYIAGCAAAITAKTSSNFMLLAAITGWSLAGAVVGTILVLLISNRFKNNIISQIKKGGLLLWVRTSDPEKEKIALNILRKHGGSHIHIHDIS